MHRVWKILAAVGGTVSAAPFIARRVGRQLFADRVEVEVRQLLAAGIGGDDTVVEAADLARLPAPVARYLEWAGVVGRSRIRTARVVQSGELRVAPDERWRALAASEHLAVFPIGFVWHAKVGTGLFSTEIRDGYFAGYGEVLARLGSFVPVGDGRGAEIDRSALVRFVSEMTYFPTAFVDRVQWEAIDETSARVTFRDDETEVSGTCVFDPTSGQLDSFRGDRWRAEDGHFVKHPWSLIFEEYTKCEGVAVPARVAATWHLDGGDFEYVRLEIQDIAFDVEPNVPSGAAPTGASY